MDQSAVGNDGGGPFKTVLPYANGHKLGMNYGLPIQNRGFNAHSVYIWDQSLSGVEMKIVTAALRKEVGGVPDRLYGEPYIGAVVPIADPIAYNTRLNAALAVGAKVNPATTDCVFQYPPIYALGVSDATPQYANSDGPTQKQWFDASAAPYGAGTYTVEFSSYREPASASQKPSFVFFQPDRVWTESEVCGAHWQEDSYGTQYCEYGNATTTWETRMPGSATNVRGEWVIFSAPHAFKLHRYQFIQSKCSVEGMPFSYEIFGWQTKGGDAHQWESIYCHMCDPTSVFDIDSDVIDKIYVIETSDHYSRYGLVVYSLKSSGCNTDTGNPGALTLNFEKWNFWGTPCTTGTYVGLDGECTVCPLGTYASSSGRESCLSCPEGMTTDNTGSTRLRECTWPPAAAGEQADFGCVSRCSPGHHCTTSREPA